MELISITKINPAKYNPRTISDEALSGLRESIKKFGMPQPLVVNRRSGVLVSGHQRLKAAEMLGWDKVPVVYVDLSPSEEKALNVTLNNKHIAGEFTDGLNELLSELDTDLLTELRLDKLMVPEINYDDFEEPAPKSEPSQKETETIKCPNCGVVYS